MTINRDAPNIDFDGYRYPANLGVGIGYPVWMDTDTGYPAIFLTQLIQFLEKNTFLHFNYLIFCSSLDINNF